MESQYTNAGAVSVSEAVVDQLRRTKGWARFFSVLLWIGAVFLILGGIAMAIMGSLGGMAGGMESAGLGGAMGIGIAIMYWVIAALYVFPALKLGGYASRITDLVNNPVEAHLVAALDQQRSFWKFVGIAMIVMIVVYIFVIIGSVAVAGIGAAAAGI